MDILAIDCSTEYLSLALQARGQRYTYQYHAGATASQLILPQIQSLLGQAGVELNHLDGIAFGAGPGAFTGVRVACGVAQGLAFGAGLPVLGINTLEALAEATEAEKVIACLDARMGEIYHAALEKKDGYWQTVCASSVCKPALAPAVLGSGWIGAGSGWEAYEAVLKPIYESNLTQLTPQILPTATAMLALAIPLFRAGEGLPASEAAPIYVRNRVALTTQERAQGAVL
jgi:tRNA threonylcarbamoyladenosine biosynthesis protein TsaB